MKNNCQTAACPNTGEYMHKDTNKLHCHKCAFKLNAAAVNAKTPLPFDLNAPQNHKTTHAIFERFDTLTNFVNLHATPDQVLALKEVLNPLNLAIEARLNAPPVV
jgi:antitoxin component of RelBE/YafQ-DinJ toxin-antitoxin module